MGCFTAHLLVKLEFASLGDWPHAFRNPFLIFSLTLDPVVRTLDKAVLYYTARLEMFQDLLSGNYFGANDKKQIKGYPISLARTVDPTKQ